MQEKSKQIEWLITQWRFDVRIKQFVFGDVILLKGNDALLDFIKNTIAKDSDNFRWNISYIVEDEKKCRKK